MLRALWAAASGMLAQQTNVDVISHNLANVNTAGFKGSRVEFGEVVFGGAPEREEGQGAGVRVLDTRRSFLPGQLEATGQPFDLAINGPGFFEVELSGGRAYTRAGSFRLGPDGRLYTAEGYPLAVSDWEEGEFDPGTLRVDPEGRVTAKDEDGDEVELGKIELVTFPNPSGLQALGGGLYLATEASGEPSSDQPPGEIWQGFLERANVQVVEEMVGLILAQRAYEMNSKVVQAADDMLGMANNLRR